MKYLIALIPLVMTATAMNEVVLTEFKLGNNLLSADIYKQVKDKSENFLISPFSLQTILALTLSGARGQTAEEIQTGLRLPKTKTLEAFTEFLPQVRSSNYTLRSANKIYVKEDFPINDDFKKIAVDNYEADLESIDFAKKSEAVKTINEWVEKQTENRIHNIVSERDITEDSRLVLVNALYFKGNWSILFLPEATTSEKFYTKEKETTVDTLNSVNFYNYYECSEVDAKFLEIFYKGNDASLVVVLPNDCNGISNLESKIEKVFTPIPFTREAVNVSLPKFKIETTIDMQEILKQLGVTTPFGNEADLSGISGKKGDIKISKVLQKTFIEVNEEGAEAAASTIIHAPAIAVSGITPVQIEPKLFVANHPFIFYIKVKDVVLFGGKVSNPKY